MQKITDNISLLVIMVMLGVLFLVVAFILLLMYSQNKLHTEKSRLQEAEIKHQEQLLRTVIESQEAERIRIGRDLHDGVGASLYNLRLSLAQTTPLLMPDLKAQIDIIIQHVRNVSHSLSPEISTLQSLTEAIEELCYRTDSTGLAVYFANTAGPVPNTLSFTTSIAIYRVMEELLTNTLKHANASAVNVNMSSKDDLLIIEYTDDGKGITDTDTIKRGRGLQNIESRLKVIKGYYSQFPNTGKGYGVRICIPVNII